MKFEMDRKAPLHYSTFEIHDSILNFPLQGARGLETKPYKISKAPDGQGPLLTNYKPKL
jgi:hypothetical protein